MPTDAAIMQRAREFRDIASWALDVPVSAVINMRCAAHNWRSLGKRKPYCTYQVYLVADEKTRSGMENEGKLMEVATYDGEWLQILELITWLKHTEKRVVHTQRFRETWSVKGKKAV